MDKKPTRWQIFKIGLGLGHPFSQVKYIDEIVDEVVIRYKDKFISILEDSKTGEIKSLVWTDNDAMVQPLIKDMWTAKPPRGKR